MTIGTVEGTIRIDMTRVIDAFSSMRGAIEHMHQAAVAEAAHQQRLERHMARCARRRLLRKNRRRYR